MKHIISSFMSIVFIVILLSGCSKKPGSVIEDFYNAETWDEKKEFILDANGLEPGDIYDEAATSYDVEEITVDKQLSPDSIIYKAKIIKTKDGNESSDIYLFLVIKIGEKEKIDFKTMLVYNEFSFAQLLNNPTTTPVKFWGKLFKSQDLLLFISKGSEMAVIGVLEEDYHLLNNPELTNEQAFVLIEVAKVVKMYDWKVAVGVKFLGVDPLGQYR